MSDNKVKNKNVTTDNSSISIERLKEVLQTLIIQRDDNQKQAEECTTKLNSHTKTIIAAQGTIDVISQLIKEVEDRNDS